MLGGASTSSSGPSVTFAPDCGKAKERKLADRCLSVCQETEEVPILDSDMEQSPSNRQSDSHDLDYDMLFTGKTDQSPILSEPIMIPGDSLSPTESQKNLSRSFEESRPRSLEIETEKDSNTSKDEPSIPSRTQSMEDVTDEEGFHRKHRLSLPGHKMSNYLKFLQELAQRQAGGVASQLFSTAVISGSKSLPNLLADTKCQIGEDGTPNIRPLETLHNALSLRKVDNFLEHITTLANYKTPSASPKVESPADSLTMMDVL